MFPHGVVELCFGVRHITSGSPKNGGLAHDMPDLMHLRGIPFTGRPCFVPAFCWPIAPRTPWGSWWWSDSRVACWSKQRLRRPGANIPWKELHHDHTMNKWWWSRGCSTKSHPTLVVMSVWWIIAFQPGPLAIIWLLVAHGGYPSMKQPMGNQTSRPPQNNCFFLHFW